jgi:hypothetical protein
LLLDEPPMPSPLRARAIVYAPLDQEFPNARTSRRRLVKHSTRLRQFANTAIVIATALLISAGHASAQTAAQRPTTTTVIDPGHWTVTPFIGIGFSGDLDSATGAFGAAGGYVWSERVGLEGEFSMLPSSEASGLVELSSDSWTLTGNILYHFAGRNWVPYGVFGIGMGHGSVDVESTDPLLNALDSSSTEFVVNFGGGIERRIRDRMAFRGDLRYFFGGDFVPDYWRASAGLTFDMGRRR